MIFRFPKNWGTKTAYFWQFYNDERVVFRQHRELSAHRSEQMELLTNGKKILKPRRYYRFPQNLLFFGPQPQTAEISICILSYPLQVFGGFTTTSQIKCEYLL